MCLITLLEGFLSVWSYTYIALYYLLFGECVPQRGLIVSHVVSLEEFGWKVLTICPFLKWTTLFFGTFASTSLIFFTQYWSVDVVPWASTLQLSLSALFVILLFVHLCSFNFDHFYYVFIFLNGCSHYRIIQIFCHLRLSVIGLL